ncbi:DeoR/GlpR transcriptional regulator [Devosia sp. WQ 349]|uniref:DeoR/GlpR family DNA-binding transcription regulator n=1 Tax=Devosia sp. WQ 349K1 TaxID=2800329 RepID=UPI001907231E|nr:DeoR/GlpR family DNA-binding transcription regulator [Devosia sp. WQ 349K1]MBK1794156.1 DeoR/GlpR transcriptional regulator [Devosia sp. WQ 349K1]
MSGRKRVEGLLSQRADSPAASNGLNERQEQILAAIGANGAASVSELAEQFNVTTQTIRRDLKLLNERGLLVKGFGGAFAAPGVARYTYNERGSTEVDIKRQLVNALKPILFDGATVFVGLGTTFHGLHQVVADFPGMLVASPNLEVIYSCAMNTDATVYVYGGYVRNKDTSILTLADGSRQKFKFDIAIIGASAIDREGSVLEFDPMEVDLVRDVLALSRRVVLVAHDGKFSQNAPHVVTHLSEVDVLVTNGDPATYFDDATTLKGLDIIRV